MTALSWRSCGGVLSTAVGAVLDVLAPESCAACGVRRSEAEQRGRGWAEGVDGAACGLRSGDLVHLCADCLAGWRQPPRAGLCGELPLWAARVETADLVAVVGAWKYRGLRGLGRPLASLLVPALQAAVAVDGPARLVPLPLHAARRRERGFDQTLQLASLAGRAAGLAVATDILVRRRATRQQASQATAGAQRRRNVSGAFAARAPRPDEPTRVGLLDDLITTGATLAEAAAALRDAGWRVAWGAALGMAARLQLDSAAAGWLASVDHDDRKAGPSRTRTQDGSRQEAG